MVYVGFSYQSSPSSPGNTTYVKYLGIFPLVSEHFSMVVSVSVVHRSLTSSFYRFACIPPEMSGNLSPPCCYFGFISTLSILQINELAIFCRFRYRSRLLGKDNTIGNYCYVNSSFFCIYYDICVIRIKTERISVIISITINYFK